MLREKASDLPSNFTLKLRKHCRTRRVEAVRQLGVDRCMELTLGSGAAAVHLVLEMYAQVDRGGGGRGLGMCVLGGVGVWVWGTWCTCCWRRMHR